MATEWKPGDPIDYIQPEIPEFEMPPYAGQRYQTMVPARSIWPSGRAWLYTP